MVGTDLGDQIGYVLAAPDDCIDVRNHLPGVVPKGKGGAADDVKLNRCPSGGATSEKIIDRLTEVIRWPTDGRHVSDPAELFFDDENAMAVKRRW